MGIPGEAGPPRRCIRIAGFNNATLEPGPNLICVDHDFKDTALRTVLSVLSRVLEKCIVPEAGVRASSVAWA